MRYLKGVSADAPKAAAPPLFAIPPPPAMPATSARAGQCVSFYARGQASNGHRHRHVNGKNKRPFFPTAGVHAIALNKLGR